MDAVCFDMDGVLVDSEDYWIELGREEVLPRVRPNNDVSIEEVSGVFYEELYDTLDANYDVAVEYDEFVSIYTDAAEEIYSERVVLTPGTRVLLQELREREVPVAMVTASPPEWYGIVLERFDLENSFDTVVCLADLDGAGKPEPDTYERAAADLGVDPRRCVAVEDSKHGTTSAHRAGMAVVGFGVGETGGGLPDADVVAETPEALREQLLGRV